MNYKLIVARDAHEDISNIAGYIIHKLKSTQAAISFLDDVEASYRQVIQNPYVYSLCNDERLSRLMYRKIAIKNYIILYRINEDAKSIFIVRVLYSGRNYQKII